jgi:hypothetical protein
MKKNNINTSVTHFTFKFIIKFMEFILDPTNLIIDLKLNCMKMCKECICIISREGKVSFLLRKERFLSSSEKKGSGTSIMVGGEQLYKCSPIPPTWQVHFIATP